MTLTLLRHTRPRDADGLCYGRLDLDVGADFEAEADAALAPLTPPARIVSSPLRRCRRLADRAAARFGVAVTLDTGFLEMDFGTWEGRPWDALPREELDAWAADFLNARPHGGETVGELGARVGAALAVYAGAPAVLIVTHAGVLKAAAAQTAGRAGWDRSFPFGTTLALA